MHTVDASHLLIAHGGTHALASAAAWQWAWDPFTAAALAVSALLYGMGLTRLWTRAGRGRGIARWQAAAFAAGLGTLALALLSPLAWLADVLFSAHMTQHEILMLVAAPLLVFGQPLLAALWALPRQWRTRWTRRAQRPGVIAAWRMLTAPLAVFLLHAAALWIWHIPVLYEAALAHDGIHAAQHVSFTVTAALFWWGLVHGRYGRSGYGAAVLYVFLTAVHSSILGALLTIAAGLWYPAYGVAGAAWGIDPLEDQHLAGLLMWVPSGVVFILFGLGLFAAWLGESEKRAALSSYLPPTTAVRRSHQR